VGRGLLEALHAQDEVFHGQMSDLFHEAGLDGPEAWISLEFSELWEVQVQMGEAVPQGWTFQNHNDFASC